MNKIFSISFILLFINLSFSQKNHGVIKVRKAKQIQGLYVLDEGDYYKTKLYIRFFDNNAAVFLRAPISAEKARDSTARLLYTYRKNPSVYKLVNDSVFIEGTENKIPFLYRGIAKNGVLNVRKISLSKQTKVVFKKLL